MQFPILPLIRVNPLSKGGLAALLAALVAAGCGEMFAGRGSEVENEFGVYGSLVDERGNSVAGAYVKARPAAPGVGKTGAGSAASADFDSVVTDSKGRYRFRNLPKGGYDLYGNAGSGELVVLIPDVFVRDTARPVPVGQDTLRSPGRIAGRVLAGGKGKPAVLCYIPGTSYLAVSDDSGRFAISGLPMGRYGVGYSSQGFLVASDSGVAVAPSGTTVLPDKELDADPALAPPAPDGLRAAADTTDGSVVLAWRPVSVRDLKGYIIYRDDPGATAPVEIGFTEDTLYRDRIRLEPGSTRSLAYSVRAMDSGSNVSGVFSNRAIVPIYRADWAYPSIAWLSPLPEIMAWQDSLRLIVRYHCPKATARKLVWYDSTGMGGIKALNSDETDVTDTLVWKPDLGIRSFSVSVFDPASNSILTASHTLRILPKGVKPVDLGPDRTAEPGDQIRIESLVDSSLGPIGRREWGNERELDFAGPDQAIAYFNVPAGRDSIVRTIKVADAHGLSASDTMVIRIRRPPGLAWKKLAAPAFQPRIWSAITTFRDKLWVFGGKSNVRRNGAVYEESISDIWSSEDGESWTKVLDAAPFGNRITFGAGEFDGKLWIIGGQMGTPLKDVWNSEDGIHWTKVADSLPFSVQQVLDVCAFKGRLWVLSPDGAWSSDDGKAWRPESESLKSNRVAQLEPRNGGLEILESSGRLTRFSDSLGGVPILLEPLNVEKDVRLMAQTPEGMFLLGYMYSGSYGCWKVADSGGAELVADSLPFEGGSLRGASFKGGVFLLEAFEVDGVTRNSMWRLP